MVNLLRFFVLLTSLAIGSAAFAQTADADLRALDERAAELEQGGDWQNALEVHRQIFARTGGKPPWNWASNHSNAAYRVGVHDEAARLLRIALQGLPPTEPNYEALRAKYEERMALLLTKVGRLQVVIAPEGAAVLLDGASVGRAPLAEELFVMPGSRELQAQLAGYQPARELVTLGAGEAKTISLVLEPWPQSPPPAPAKPADEGLSPTRLGVGITGVGLGIVGVAVAVVLGVTAADRGDNVDDLTLTAQQIAPNGPSCGAGSPALSTTICDQIDEQAREQLTYQGAAIGAGIAGGVLLIGGILTLALPSDSDDVEVGVHAGLSSAGLELQGRF